MDNTEIYTLNNIKIHVSENHRFGTDAFLLAEFANALPSHKVCDLCSGCGIIPLLMCREKPPMKLYGVEIDSEASALFEAGIKDNNLQLRAKALCMDLRDIAKGVADIPYEYFDMVTVNPPYSKNGSGKQSENAVTAAARHEVLCDIDDVVTAAAKLLKFGGSLKLCQLPSRLTDVMCSMRAHGIEPKILTTVTKKKGMAPWLVLVSGKKGAKSGLVIEKEFYIYEESGEYSDRVKALYNIGK